MMETKLWFALCALLLFNSGSAEHAAASTNGTEASQHADTTPSSSPGPIAPSAPALNGSDTTTGSNGISNTTTAVGTTSPTAKTKNATDINIVSHSVAENNGSLTDKMTTQPPGLPQAATSHIPPSSTTTSPTHRANTTSVDTANTVPPSNTSTPISKQPTHPETHSSTLAPTPEPPKPETNATSANSTQSNSTSSGGSSHRPPASVTQTVTSPHTSQSDRAKSTVSPTAEAVPHADTPSQLNVGGDTTMVHESPTLDPLLAGLVSAFIITAVIITLLLFLKLRRRDSRPGFRRLQDLPMDDMMEDTPLSMYTY